MSCIVYMLYVYNACEVIDNNYCLNYTCSTDAPEWRNCKPTSAESIPPVARTGKPGSALAMADTARRAIGRMAFPETPPYVVFLFFPMFGHASP